MIVDWPSVVSHVVHDVRALARKGLSNAQLLEREAGGSLSPVQQNQLSSVIASQRDLDRLMSQLRGLVEAAAAEHDLLWADVQDLDTLILSARLEQAALLQSCAAHLIVDALPSAAVPLKLHFVIGELLRNAVQFRAPSGAVEIRIGGSLTPDGQLQLQVEDNGLGWDPQFTDRLFQPFLRLSATGSGSGLGLAISRAWVEAAGGNISAQSAPGLTRFTVALPLQK